MDIVGYAMAHFHPIKAVEAKDFSLINLFFLLRDAAMPLRGMEPSSIHFLMFII